MLIHDIQAEFERHKLERARLVEELKGKLPKLLAPLFDKHPKLEAVSWTQYTPYFNDGDVCEFAAHTDYLTVLFDGQEYEELGSYSFRSDRVHRVDFPDGLQAAY